MKTPVLLLILILLAGNALAQDTLEQALKEALQLSEQGMEASKKSAGHLGFLNGAFDRAEINRHLLDAREDLDSLVGYTRQAAYRSSDATYFARTTSNEKQEQLAVEAHKALQTATRTLNDVIKKIDEFIIHGSSNYDTYLNQRLQDFEQATRQLDQARQKLKQAHKLVTADRE
jgi:cellobiose-specific phosphotransferase system component IIA